MLEPAGGSATTPSPTVLEPAGDMLQPSAQCWNRQTLVLEPAIQEAAAAELKMQKAAQALQPAWEMLEPLVQEATISDSSSYHRATPWAFFCNRPVLVLEPAKLEL